MCDVHGKLTVTDTSPQEALQESQTALQPKFGVYQLPMQNCTRNDSGAVAVSFVLMFANSDAHSTLEAV